MEGIRNKCHLKSGDPSETDNSDVVSGFRGCPLIDPDPEHNGNL